MTEPCVLALINELYASLSSWSTSLSADPPTFLDSLSAQTEADRTFLIDHLREDISKLLRIASRGQERVHTGMPTATATPFSSNARVLGPGQTAFLARSFKGPGGRHDNDKALIQDIQLVPTHGELTAAEVRIDAVGSSPLR